MSVADFSSKPCWSRKAFFAHARAFRSPLAIFTRHRFCERREEVGGKKGEERGREGKRKREIEIEK